MLLLGTDLQRELWRTEVGGRISDKLGTRQVVEPVEQFVNLFLRPLRVFGSFPDDRGGSALGVGVNLRTGFEKTKIPVGERNADLYHFIFLKGEYLFVSQ